MEMFTPAFSKMVFGADGETGAFVEWCCEDAGLAKSALRSQPGISFERLGTLGSSF